MTTDSKGDPGSASPGDENAPSGDESARLITRSAGKMGMATSLSRVLGLARDMVFASIFGTSAAADAFNLAFTIPNFFRRLLGEGVLAAAFVPVYSEHLETRPREEVHRLGSAALTDLSVVLAGITVVGMIAARPLVQLYAPGWQDRPDQVVLTTGLTRFLFPYILFVGLAALVQAMLHAAYRFTVPALSPVVLNVCFIAAGLFLCPMFGPGLEDQIFGFAVGGVVGGLGQLLIQTPVLSSIGFRFRPRLDFRSPAVREVLGLMGPGLFGLAVAQINMVIDTLLATYLVSGSVTALRLGTRVALLPLGVFGVAMASASLPVLSRRIARGDLGAAREIFSHTTRMIFFLLIPASVGLIILREPIIRLLFVRGAFDANESLRMTATVIMYYAIGLFAYGGVKGVAQVFYSLKNTATPVRVAAVALTLNVVLNLLLMGPLGVGGLALASSISSIANMGILIVLLRRRVGAIAGGEILASVARIGIACAVMAVASATVFNALAPVLSETDSIQLAIRLLTAIVAALVTYFGMAGILRMREMTHLASIFRRRAG